ncbi:MAG: hypothetical protein C4519_08185 [Desulfobacteraceae bacterium]|nr:MAG: hypothetical protein C4519_08185 [Desulfobacteraceae bacterium]
MQAFKPHVAAIVIFSVALVLPASLLRAQQIAHPVEGLQEIPAAGEKLVRLDPRSMTFKVVQGENEGRLVSVSLSNAAADPEGWELFFEGLYTLLIRRDRRGAVAIEEVDLQERGKRIVFEPPLTLIPEVLRAGERIQNAGRADIFDLQTGEPTHSAGYDFTIRTMSRAVFNIPAGRISGYLLEYEFHIDLALANIRIDLESGWSDQQQLIYWRSKRTVEKLGFFGSTTFRTMALAGRKQAGNPIAPVSPPPDQ